MDENNYDTADHATEEKPKEPGKPEYVNNPTAVAKAAHIEAVRKRWYTEGHEISEKTDKELRDKDKDISPNNRHPDQEIQLRVKKDKDGNILKGPDGKKIYERTMVGGRDEPSIPKPSLNTAANATAKSNEMRKALEAFEKYGPKADPNLNRAADMMMEKTKTNQTIGNKIKNIGQKFKKAFSR